MTYSDTGMSLGATRHRVKYYLSLCYGIFESFGMRLFLIKSLESGLNVMTCLLTVMLNLSHNQCFELRPQNNCTEQVSSSVRQS